MLADATREVLAAHCPPKLVRAAGSEDSAAARRGELWSQLAELGLFGLLVPEAHGGLGLTVWDAVLALEELGRAAAPGPIIETALVGTSLLTSTPHAPWLARVAAGDAAVAARLMPGQYPLDADLADVIVSAHDGELHALSPAAVRLTAQPAVDPSRRLFSLEWVPEPGSRFATGEDARIRVAAACDLGSLGTAAQLLGIGQHLLEVTVEYAKQRRQFGRPIGGFQAVKHQLADVLLALEFARPLVYRAAFTLGRAEPTASRDASAAKASATDAAELAARVALQVHGAIGYTAEFDLHLWLTRVWALRGAWGDPAWHRRRVAEALLGSGGAHGPVSAPGRQ